MADASDDHGAVAALKVEVRSLREETSLNRRRYHELSNLIAPLVLAESMTNRHELELRDLRSLVDRGRGLWFAVSVMGAVIAATGAGLLALISHVLGGHAG